jgi:SAM-dependent methyltransferase
MGAPIQGPTYSHRGWCPVCGSDTTFVAYHPWYRDSLVCTTCEGYSNVRERALMLVLRMLYPSLAGLAVHESSPATRGASRALAALAGSYVSTHYFPDRAPGSLVDGFRNENLERQTFADASFDLVVSLDVMEHVDEPRDAFREIARTLKPGGRYVFTAPTEPSLEKTERRAQRRPDGSMWHLGTPEYHGNPIDESGSLVTFKYGYDLPELISAWSGMDTTVMRFHDERHGVLGAYTEVYACTEGSSGTV